MLRLRAASCHGKPGVWEGRLDEQASEHPFQFALAFWAPLSPPEAKKRLHQCLKPCPRQSGFVVPVPSERWPWSGSPGPPGAWCSWKGKERREVRGASRAVNKSLHPIAASSSYSTQIFPPLFLAREIFLQEKLHPVSKTAGQGERPKSRSGSGQDPLHVLMSCSGSKSALAPRAGIHQEPGDIASCSEPTSR